MFLALAPKMKVKASTVAEKAEKPLGSARTGRRVGGGGHRSGTRTVAVAAGSSGGSVVVACTAAMPPVM